MAKIKVSSQMRHPYMIDNKQLKSWFDQTKRSFPWRETPSPYSVWVSEVMLQQTRAEVVIPYFLRWMQQFPTIEALAKAPLDEVIKAWEGLGYYSRARNLHDGAKYLVENHKGSLPNSTEELSKIKGLGPYTIGAIQSFAFKKKAAAVDGNVLRVLARHFLIKEAINKTAVQKKIRALAESLLPEQKPWIFTEALIELGATLCTPKNPDCLLCPIRSTCQAHQKGMVDQLPIKEKKAPITNLFRTVAIICCNQQYLLQQGKKGEIMEGLYEFPYTPLNQEETNPHTCFAKKLLKHNRFQKIKTLYPVIHTFTRYKVTLYPALFHTPSPSKVKGMPWVSEEEMMTLPFSSGHRKIKDLVLSLTPDLLQ